MRAANLFSLTRDPHRADVPSCGHYRNPSTHGRTCSPIRETGLEAPRRLHN